MKNNFANNLILSRKALKLTQKQLADMLNVAQRTISAWENRICEPSIDLLLHLCTIFNEAPDGMIL